MVPGPQAETEARFVAALFAPDAARPEGLTGPGGRAAGKRFDVYRNNVAVSLTEALGAAFPVVRKLLGEAFFRAMAGVFLRQHPPTSPMMMHYGAQMPGFLATFPPVAQLPYLPDVARLELALREAYHAADAVPLNPEALAELPDPSGVRLRLAPAVRVVASDHPVHGIWAVNSIAGAPKPRPGAQTALVTRPDFDPVVDPLTPADGALVLALQAGAPLGADPPAGADLGRVLSLLMSRNAVTDLCP